MNKCTVLHCDYNKIVFKRIKFVVAIFSLLCSLIDSNPLIPHMGNTLGKRDRGYGANASGKA
jgi:hypothetical protein